jgi:predicted DNA binding CopG/RHH family protein
MKKQLELPNFKSEDEERAFWANLDLSEYYEPSDMKRVSFPNLKPTSKPISLRVPEYILNRIKEKANAMDIPYQSLIKQKLKELAFGR